MPELKTKKNKKSVADFINKISDDQKKKDSKDLLKIFRKITGKKPSMWGDSIIGFGSYHYKSNRSSQEGDWPLTGFSPRKQNISIYIMPGFKKYNQFLKKIGKHKVSRGSCLYIKKLSDIDVKILEKLIKDSIKEMKKNYETK